jgi:hypothetical protein
MKKTIKVSKMRVIGFVALAAIIVLTMAGCDNSGGDNSGGDGTKLVTFYLHKISNDYFLLIVDGANWRDDPPTGLVDISGSDPLIGTLVGGTTTAEGGFNHFFNIQPPPVKTFHNTWQYRLNTSYVSVSGKIELSSDQGVLNQAGFITTDGGMYLPAGETNYTRHPRNYFLES